MAMPDPAQSDAATVQRLELGASAVADTQLDERLQGPLHLSDKSTPVIRGRAGACFQLPIFYYGEDDHQSQAVVQSDVSSNAQQQPQTTSGPPVRTHAQNTQSVLSQGQSPPMSSTAQENHLNKILENSNFCLHHHKEALHCLMGKFYNTSPSFTPLKIWLKVKQTTTDTDCSFLYSLQKAKLKS